MLVWARGGRAGVEGWEASRGGRLVRLGPATAPPAGAALGCSRPPCATLIPTCLRPRLPAAGIGRSGVFCVLDIVTRRLLHLQQQQQSGAVSNPEAVAAAATAAVDVAALVADLRCVRGECRALRQMIV